MSRLLSILAAVIVLLPSVAFSGEIGIDVRFSNQEVELIRAYYREHGTVTNGGGRKSKGLPPGIAKNLYRGKTLPPGIAKQALPGDLLRTLPPAPDGYERLVLAGKVLLVETATQVIHDVLTHVILN